MRLLSRIAIAIVSAWMGIHVDPAASQTFNDRFSIIPKAKAEPANPEPAKPEPAKAEPSPGAGHPVWQAQSRMRAEPTRGSEDRSGIRSSKRRFSGKASYYSYRSGK